MRRLLRALGWFVVGLLLITSALLGLTLYTLMAATP